MDFVALLFVRSPDDVRDLRKLIDEAGSQARVIAKIEKAEAVHELGPIVDAADAVMVARGTSASRSARPRCRCSRSG